MHKFYTASGRLVLYDDTTHNIYKIRYVNDQIAQPTKKDFICTANESLLSSGNLRPYTPTISR